MDKNGQQEKYDMITVGAGPAAFSAALYAVRYRLDTLILGQMPGGTMTEAHKVCNFPTETEISGPELAQKMQQTATHHGAEMKSKTVREINPGDEYFEVITTDGESYYSLTTLMAIGTKRRKLDVLGEKEFLGRGISYCATCDGMFYKDKTVAVIGGSDSALTAALYLADVAEKIYLIYRGDELKGGKAWRDQVKDNSVIEVLYNTQIQSVEGENKVEKISVESPEGPQDIEVNGVFVEVGAEPDTKLLDPLGIEKDDKGFIDVARDQSTNIPGIWAAGDITNGSNGFRQIITAASEGAIAAESISRYFQKKKDRS